MYESISARAYLGQKNIPVVAEANGELIVRCIFDKCDHDSQGKEGHLYINAETSQYRCQKCGAEGNLKTLANYLGDDIGAIVPEQGATQKLKLAFSPCWVINNHRNLSAEFREYLNNRGIPNEVIDRHEIGEYKFVDKETKAHVRWITIPVRNEKAESIYFKLRRDPSSDKKPKLIVFPAGNESSIFGIEKLQVEQKKAFIAEGELDALVLETQGLVAVSSTAGANTFKSEWAKHFEKTKEVYICYDNDDEGRKGALMVAKKLSVINGLKIFIVILPERIRVGKKGDITDYFTEFNGTMDELLSWAKPYLAEEKNDKDSAITQSYECNRDGYKWIFEKRKLGITKISDNKIIFSDVFGSEHFWVNYSNLEKVRKAVSKIGIYKDKKEVQKAVFEIFTDVRTNWKIESKKDAIQRESVEKLKGLISDRKITLEEVHEAVSKIGMYLKELLETIVAVTISAQMRNKPPLWLMIVGPPSSIKTELVKMLDYLNGTLVYYVDSMTENAFASGFLPKDGSEPHDLLPELDGKCFIVKDYTTMFSLNEETLKKILGDMTSMFDEDFNKFSATRGNVTYKSLFSQIGCITPSVINKHQRYMSQIGARFLYYRVPELDADSEKKGFGIAWSDETGEERKKLINEARIITSSFCKQLIDELPNIKLKTESEEIRGKINNLAKFISKARGIVNTRPASFIKDGKEIKYNEVIDIQIEQPWRAFQQVRALARFLAITRGKQEVDMEEIETMKDIAIASMPVHRARVLASFKGSRMLESAEIAEIAGISPRTAQRVLKELISLKILDKIEESEWKKVGATANSYFPVSDFEDILLGESAKMEEVAVTVPAYEEKDEIDVNSLF
jgi:5S rRNA maturation endonuclease (ribonuclease M5)